MNYRQMCYNCNRPTSSCLCQDIKPIETTSKFVILMHPKEFKKIKNNTGRLTHLSLSNSELFVGVDFTNHKKVNALINDDKNFCTVLFPAKDSICINDEKLDLKDKKLVIFVIDATWDSAKPILRQSVNLHKLQKISFTHTKSSAYQFKRQPFAEALSTMESTLCVLETLTNQKLETISDEKLKTFIEPFEKLVESQMKFISSQPRFKKI